MRYDPADRVLSLSFARDREEHADVMLETSRRMTTTTDPVSAWTGFGMVIGFGVAVGAVMELHRRFVLPSFLGPAEIAPLGTIMAQLLPLVLLIIALYALFHIRAIKRRRRALLSRLNADLVIDVDIFIQGLTSSSDGLSIDIDWSCVSSVVIDSKRIEIECECFSVYIPERAFENRKAFTRAAREVRDLWRDAVKRERDSKLLAAGLN